MEPKKLRRFHINSLAAAFAIPVVGMLVLMIIAQVTPFGTASMLYSDNYHQYYPFFKAFRATLRSGGSLLYTWDVGLGLDYLGLISYYLASPLNLLSVLVPEKWLLSFYTLLFPLRMGFASLFFAIFLKKLFGKSDLSIAVFGSFYGMCAWAMGYQWNVMWMDTFALLPLVALGAIYLLRDKKFILYTVTLFLSVFANYYIGFFTCIFMLLLFICYEICRWRGFGRFFGDLCRMALFSALAIGMTAILELPTLAALQTTQSSVNQFPQGFKLNIADTNTWKGLLEAMVQVAGNMSGGIEPTFKEGLPNIYCGIGSVMLAFLFLTAKNVKLRDKICSVLLLIFFILSFIIRQLDYIWHGFHFTNMIPYRFSFLYSFVLLYMAYRAYLLRNRFRLWQVLIAGALTLCIFGCAGDWDEPVFRTCNLIFWLLYLAALIYICWDKPIKKPDLARMREAVTARQNRRRYAAIVLPAIMGLELIINIVNFGTSFTFYSIADYPRGTEESASMIRYMQEREENNLFYRAETTHSQTLNDGALNGYYGISTFTSSANVKVTEFMKALGYGAKNTYNRYCFEESSPVSNLFLGLKYMLERSGNVEENPYFDEVHHYGNVYLLENNAYLPLGFLANSDLALTDITENYSHFYYQNTLFTAATGIADNVWSLIPGTWLTLDGGSGVEIVSSGNGFCSYKSSDGGQLTYRYEIYQSGFMCVDLSMDARNSFTIYHNDTPLYTESLSLPQMLSVCQVEPGDVVELRITCKAGENSSMTIRAGLLNEELFRQGYDILNASTLELSAFSDTRVQGSISCNRDGLLYTSIPQNGNWHAKVDGQEVSITLVGGVMCALELSEGEHTVEFYYRNDAFGLGWKISLACALVFAAIIFLQKRPKQPYKAKFLRKQ